jgi:hypothetical protein
VLTQITDPADRLGWAGDGSGKEFVTALEKRYETGPIAMAIPDFAERYGNICDLMVQLLWPERYGASPDDPFLHTSDPARAIARLICRAAGIDPEPIRP